MVRMDRLTLRCQVPGVLEAIWNLRYSPESAVLCILSSAVWFRLQTPLGRSRTCPHHLWILQVENFPEDLSFLLSELP